MTEEKSQKAHESTNNNEEFSDILSLEEQQTRMFAPEKNSDLENLQAQTGRTSTLSPVNPVTSTRSVTGFNPLNNLDSIEQWRQMSEIYRKKRLSTEARERQQPRETEHVKSDEQQKKHREAKLQETYELDSFYFTAPNSVIAEDLRKRILTSDVEINPELLVEPEHEEYPPLEDGTLQISDVMSKNVVCIIESMTIEQVASLFNRRKLSSVPVVHYITKQLTGIISISDILFHTFEDKAVSTFHNDGGHAVFQQDSLAILERPVADFMSTDVLQVAVNNNVRDVCKLMLEKKLHNVIVTKGGLVKGIFTSFDAVRLLSDFDLKIHQD